MRNSRNNPSKRGMWPTPSGGAVGIRDREMTKRSQIPPANPQQFFRPDAGTQRQSHRGYLDPSRSAQDDRSRSVTKRTQTISGIKELSLTDLRNDAKLRRRLAG